MRLQLRSDKKNILIYILVSFIEYQSYTKKCIICVGKSLSLLMYQHSELSILFKLCSINKLEFQREKLNAIRCVKVGI